jgi:hypothetical protein
MLLYISVGETSKENLEAVFISEILNFKVRWQVAVV